MGHYSYSGAPLLIDGFVAGIINTELTERGNSKELNALSVKYFKALLVSENLRVLTKESPTQNKWLKVLTDSWFKRQVSNSVDNLGVRYTAELNFKLDVAKNFDFIVRNDSFRTRVEAHFHKFLAKINNALGQLSQSSQHDEISQLSKSILTVENQYHQIQEVGIIFVDTPLLLEKIGEIADVLSTIQDTGLNEQTDSSYADERALNEAREEFYEFHGFLKSHLLKLANNPHMLLAGEAGIGKSHLLADIAMNRVNAKQPCIFLLGQLFTSNSSPWEQILRNLLRIECNEEELLDALNDIGMAQGERVLFIIDAINEGHGKYFWPEYINGFISDFKKYPWVGLVLSVRTSYERLLTPDDFLKSQNITKIRHAGFRGKEHEATSLFFRWYRIDLPSVPLFNPEFSNPLFLKLFCEGLNRKRLHQIPKGYGGISSIIDFFIESVDSKLSKPVHFDYPEHRKLVRKVIDGLIKFKLNNNLPFIPYDDAFDIADQILTRYSNKRRFLDALIEEGVLSKNLFWQGNDKNEEGIYLAYERFEDHLTTAFLLDEHLDLGNPAAAFQINGAMESYIVDRYDNQGIIESLSIQLPERVGKELYELLDEKQKDYESIIESFIASLLWRKLGTIEGKTKSYVNNFVLQYKNTYSSFFDVLYCVAADPAHYYNADMLHGYLQQFTMADRDTEWMSYLHDAANEGSTINKLIDWAQKSDNKLHLSDQSRVLLSKAFAWIFTSTNIGLRDSATKALVVVLEDNLVVTVELLSDFETVNDPYVYERLLAGIYGAVLRSHQLNGLGDLANYLIAAIFLKEEVYPNVLVRDFARNIVEYALYKELITLESPEVIRPPYVSVFPASFPSNEEIDSFKFDYDADGFKDYYWSQNEILSSMVTEYGRGIGGYGDFGRYTFQCAVSDWAQFKPNDLSNYACKLIFEKYGYNVEKHGLFDHHASSDDRHSNKIERIGKKYQWIALYEILARLADNHKMCDETIGWGDEQGYIYYQGPWHSHIRNIDPTMLSENIKKREGVTIPSVPFYSNWQESEAEWLVSDKNLPNPVQLIDSNGFFTLEHHNSWQQPIPLGIDKQNFPRKTLWYQIRSYFVVESEFDELVNWLQNQHFMGRWLPESRGSGRVFCREYYWSPAYKDLDKPYYGGQEWQEILRERRNQYCEDVVASVLPTTEWHSWEAPEDSGDSISFLAPRPIMFDGMKLNYSNLPGEWHDANGQIVCCDPSVTNRDVSTLIVQKSQFQQYLTDNKLKVVWTCLGRKEVHGRSIRHDGPNEWLEMSGVYSLDGDVVKGKLRPFVQRPGEPVFDIVQNNQ